MDYVIRKATPTSKTSSSGQGPGRPIQFDRDSVIERAVEVYWRNGVDSTPLDLLVSELGVSRSTLYSSFGGKDGLLASAIDLYLAQLLEELVTPLHEGSEGLNDLLDFLERLRPVLLGSDYPPGCLIINAMCGSDNNEPGRRYAEIMLSGFRAALRRSAAAGEIDEADIEPQAAMLLSQVIGLNVAAKANLAADLIDLSLRATFGALEAASHRAGTGGNRVYRP